MKERLVAMLLRVLLKKLDGIVGDRDGGIIVAAALDGRQRFAVEPMTPRRKEAVLIFEHIRSIEAALERIAVKMPLAGVI